MISRRILVPLIATCVAAVLIAGLGGCTTPEMALGLRADYDGGCAGEGTVVIRYHFGSDLQAPAYGHTSCWMREDGLPMCRIDLSEHQAKFSDLKSLAEIGHEACHAMGGHHGQ